jgi:hypothetical protein
MAIMSGSSKTVNKSEQEPIKQGGSPRNTPAQSINLLSDGFPNAISSSNTVSVTIPKTSSNSITNSNPEAFPVAISGAIPKSNSDHAHCSTPIEEGELRQWLCKAVSKHLSSL